MQAIWRGTTSFGLVSVAVWMFTATESKELRFHFLHKDDLTRSDDKARGRKRPRARKAS